MKCLFDSNVIIDAFTDRPGAVEVERKLLYFAVVGEITGVISAKQMTDIYYVLRKYFADDDARRDVISLLLEGFEIISVDKSILTTALGSDIPDFEDAVIDTCARVSNSEVIITNDKRGFESSHVKAVTPEEIARQLGL